jgi:transcriptional regulator GlxA family with amidase domain
MRLHPLFDLVHQDLDEAARGDVAGLVKAAFVLGKIAEQLDGQPAAVHRQWADQWEPAVERFNMISEDRRSSFRL